MPISNRISWIVFLFVAMEMVQVISGVSKVPALPTRPERFQSREELKRYLQLVHEYYSIIGQPRFGRGLTNMRIRSLNDEPLFNFFDTNGDDSISYEEFHHLLRD